MGVGVGVRMMGKSPKERRKTREEKEYRPRWENILSRNSLLTPHARSIADKNAHVTVFLP